jgi:hypothetical protein
MKTILLRKFQFSCLQSGVLVMALVCFSTQAKAGAVLPAIGPRPAGEYDKVDYGYLTVYSATEQNTPAAQSNGDYYSPHSAYWIYDATGKRIRTVQNHGGYPEEGPDKVELAPGTYTVKAWSEKDGLVTVPVIIKLARNTSVHLEQGRESDAEAMNPAKAVKTPNGQVVGWKA